MTRKLAIGVWFVLVLVYLGEVILLFVTADIPSQSGTSPLLQAAQDLAFVVATLAMVLLSVFVTRSTLAGYRPHSSPSSGAPWNPVGVDVDEGS